MAPAPRSGFYYALASVPLMGAGIFGPDVFHLSLEAKTIAFYGCVGLAALCVVIGAVKELRAEANISVTTGHRRRMIAISGMCISGISFLTFATIYFWPQRPTNAAPPTTAVATPSSPKTPWKHTLEDLYKSDFNLLSVQRELQFSAPNTTPPIIIDIRCRLYYDYASNVDFVSIFIPISRNVRVDDEIYELINWLRDYIPKARNELRASVGTGMGAPGVPYTEGKDLIFSGRVFIYTMKDFTVIQLGDITRWYKDAGMALQIRDYAYWFANKDR